jgi:hypothetical protein
MALPQSRLCARLKVTIRDVVQHPVQSVQSPTAGYGRGGKMVGPISDITDQPVSAACRD